MPVEGCTRDAGISDTGICDMIGNLWEWVDNPWQHVDEDHGWQKGYKMIKGGSLYSNEKALEINSYSLEHPTSPHSPTRLGFRCIRRLSTSR